MVGLFTQTCSSASYTFTHVPVVFTLPFFRCDLMKISNKKAFFEESIICLITRSGQLCTNFIILSYLRLKTGREQARWKLFIALPVYTGNTLHGILMSPEVTFRAKYWLSLSQVYWVTQCGHRASFSSASLRLPTYKCKTQGMKSIPLKSIIILLAQDFIPDQFQQSACSTLGPQACQEGRERTHSPTILMRLTAGEPVSPMANQHFKGVLSPFIAV